jgi:serine/threonine protein kinase
VKHIKHAARHGKSILREVRLLARLRHENLLQLIDFPAVSGPDFEDVFLVLPYLPADLHKVIHSKQPLSNKHVQVIICQILRALAHLHACSVAHRDLKPANILLEKDCKLKVCDFGLARGDMRTSDDGDGDEEEQACGVLTEYVVTRWYRAPEVMLLPKHYTTTVDLWSVGCILGEICGRKPLFPGKNHVDMIIRVAQVLGTPSDDELNWLPKKSDAYRFVRRVCPPSEGIPLSSLYPDATRPCLDLMRGLLGWDPARRLTADEAQEHEYLRCYLPKERPIPPEPFDWSFDGFRPTTNAVKERLYRECVRFHPEILDREAAALAAKLSSVPSPRLGERALPPRPPRGSHAPALAAWASARDQEQQQRQQRQMSAGCPPGAPSSRNETPLSARSSPGCGYMAPGTLRSSYDTPSSVRSSYDTPSCRTSPQAPYMAPPARSMIPQPHFGGRSHAAHQGRSITPPRPSRVLAR